MGRRRKPKEIHVHHYGRRDRKEQSQKTAALIFAVVGGGIGAIVGGFWGAGIGAVVGSGVGASLIRTR